MEDEHKSGSTRRLFLGRTVPACAFTCLGLASLPALGETKGQSQASGQAAKPDQPARHVFDEEMPRKLTYRELMRTATARFIPLVLSLSKALGREKAIELLKVYSSEQARIEGAETARQFGGNDLATLQRVLTTGASRNIWIAEIVETTDRAFQVKATECLFARTFQEAHADKELGYAAVCHGDYAWAEGFNPKIELRRDKTLMQGDSFCNHRYVIKA